MDGRPAQLPRLIQTDAHCAADAFSPRISPDEAAVVGGLDERPSRVGVGKPGTMESLFSRQAGSSHQAICTCFITFTSMVTLVPTKLEIKIFQFGIRRRDQVQPFLD